MHGAEQDIRRDDRRIELACESIEHFAQLGAGRTNTWWIFLLRGQSEGIDGRKGPLS